MGKSRVFTGSLVVTLLLIASGAQFALASGTPNPAQGIGSTGMVQGTVADPTGAVVAGASVELQNPHAGYRQTTTTDVTGHFEFRNVPQDSYHLTASAKGFQPAVQDVTVRSLVPVTLQLVLPIATSSMTVEVEASANDLIESNPVAHTDVGTQLLKELPVTQPTSALNSVITNSTAGVVADSNGFFHPLGEHADTSFSVDNQPINDQQSRAFSNQLPLNTVDSMEIITGVPPAEFGDKTSLVVRTNTKSGIGLQTPHGSVNASYGSFGTPTASVTFGAGATKWGNYVAVDGMRTGRFFDTPEWRPMHDIGNNENFFDRADWQPRTADTMHLDVWVSRSWSQIPNTYDQEFAGQDQRQQIRSFNIAPAYTHLFTQTTLLSANAWVRQDRVGYFPSNDLFADEPATVGETRRLTNAGIKTDLSYVKGKHNFKAGVQWMHTLLSENLRFGITNPTFNPVCLDANGNPVPASSITDPSQCAGAGFSANPDLLPGLVPYDLTRGGSLFAFQGHTDVKEEAVYAQDTISVGHLTITPGIRFDNYDGLSHGNAVQPRIGGAYLIQATNTVLRASYGRLFETPYNENLVISSSTGSGGLASTSFGGFGVQPLRPGTRNAFDVGFQQAIGKHIAVDAEYFWKFTDRAFDFDTLFSTPMVFPIEWRKSKIDGLTARVTFPAYHGLSGYVALGHTRARFFGPEVGGLIFNSPLATGPFRIDHDEALSQTTHVQYQIKKRGPWFGLTWRYDSGEVAGSVPDAATALSLTADEQQQMGLFCGSTFATLSNPITSCPISQFGATRVRIPAPGTENDDTNPARIAPRHLIDLAAGIDNLLRLERPRLSLRFTAVNVTNKDALYNFLSTFSGTHFVTPRSYTAEVGLSF